MAEDDFESRFGRELRRLLRERGLTQTRLADRLGTSSAYVSSIARGQKRVLPERIDSMAESLDLSSEDRARLHRAAALDLGFRLDLPEDFDD